MLHSVKYRIEGLPSAVEAAVADLRERHQIIEASRPYPNRGDSKLVRQYLTALVETPVPGITVARDAVENRELVERRRRPQLPEG